MTSKDWNRLAELVDESNEEGAEAAGLRLVRLLREEAEAEADKEFRGEPSGDDGE